jgi:disulfide bond formation protein DsbB
MPPFCEKLLTMPLAAKLLLLASVGSLLFALIMQFGFGLQPCILCLLQRAPFCASAAFALAAWVWKPYQLRTAALLALCSIAYLVGMGLAVFHSGVELHWWMGTSGCAVQPLTGATAEDLRETLLHTVTPRCDQITWTIFGLSMANLNIALSLGLALFSGAASAKCVHDARK